MTEFVPTPEQATAISLINRWFINGTTDTFVLSGIAGSGKTEIVSQLVHWWKSSNVISGSIVGSCFTGRGAQQLLVRIPELYGSYTLHSLLYEAEEISRDKWAIHKRTAFPFSGINLLIVDEASMIPRNIYDDLMNLAHNERVPVLFLGDIYQLPPVSDDGFNLLNQLDFHLEYPVRQTLDNPIYALARNTRESNHLNITDSMNNIHTIPRHDVTVSYLRNNPVDVILTGTNKERERMNMIARAALNRTSESLMHAEPLICLRNGFVSKGDVNEGDFNGARLTNGTVFGVEMIKSFSDHLEATLCSDFYQMDDGRSYRVLIDFPLDFLHNPERGTKDCDKVWTWFDFGYALSVWKAQGSEYDKVLFVDEDVSWFVDRKKFRYTAITRAKKELLIAL